MPRVDPVLRPGAVLAFGLAPAADFRRAPWAPRPGPLGGDRTAPRDTLRASRSTTVARQPRFVPRPSPSSLAHTGPRAQSAGPLASRCAGPHAAWAKMESICTPCVTCRRCSEHMHSQRICRCDELGGARTCNGGTAAVFLKLPRAFASAPARSRARTCERTHACASAVMQSHAQFCALKTRFARLPPASARADARTQARRIRARTFAMIAASCPRAHTCYRDPRAIEHRDSHRRPRQLKGGACRVTQPAPRGAA